MKRCREKSNLLQKTIETDKKGERKRGRRNLFHLRDLLFVSLSTCKIFDDSIIVHMYVCVRICICILCPLTPCLSIQRNFHTVTLGNLRKSYEGQMHHHHDKCCIGTSDSRKSGDFNTKVLNLQLIWAIFLS
ncbi:hypothetical protein DINM_004939 [Dirofilaria immitis]|nr:hypothetical protein [Dirofilaria immitis]